MTSSTFANLRGVQSENLRIRNCLEEGLRMSVKSDALMEIELVSATDVFMLKMERLLK